MKRRAYRACGIAALAFAACSGDNGANALNDVREPVVDLSSSSVTEPLSSLAESSDSVEQSSSSLFGLSSSAPVPESSSAEAELSSSSAALSNSSAELLSSSSTVLSSSSESCVMKSWEQLGGDYPYIEARICESSWPDGAIADGKWRVMYTDSSCPYCGVFDERVGAVTVGNSSVTWLEGVSEKDEVPTSTIEACGGSPCGTAVLDQGTLTYNPFVSIGFTFARDESGKPVPVDVSDWGGVCIDYASDAAPSLELDLGDSLNSVLGYAYPAVSLSKSSYGTRKCFTWDQFKVPSWYRGEAKDWLENTGVKASKQLVGVMFKIQTKPGEYNFRINDFSSHDRSSFDVFSVLIAAF